MAIVLSGYFLLSLLDYYTYLSVWVKTLLFFLFVAISVVCLGWLVVVPLLAYFRLGKVIDHTTAEIGRASCRERVCQEVWISVVAASVKKKQTISQVNYV